MKAYGLPRMSGVEYPDKADIKEFGLSTADRSLRLIVARTRLAVTGRKRLVVCRSKESAKWDG